MPTDIIGREISVGDYVVFYNNIYSVVSTGKTSLIKLLLVDKAKTTKAVYKNSAECCIIPRNEVLLWLIKRENG